MIHLIQDMKQFMFSTPNMNKGYTIKPKHKQASVEQASVVYVEPEPQVTIKPTLVTPIDTKPFTPFQKDKLFWCFFIIIKGYEEYEMSRSNSFSIEKKINIPNKKVPLAIIVLDDKNSLKFPSFFCVSYGIIVLKYLLIFSNTPPLEFILIIYK